QHILIVRGGAVGDFILTMPVLAALRNQFPRARVEVLGNPSIASLATRLGLADNIRDLGSFQFAPLFSCNGVCSSDIAKWLSRFDLIVSYAYDPERVFENNLCRHSNAQFIAGPYRPNEQSIAHASVQMFGPLAGLIPCSFDVGCWTLDVE